MRITKAVLEKDVARINNILGTPLTPYSLQEDGRYKPNAGNYHLESANGGYALSQMSEIEMSTGERNVLACGYVDAATLHAAMQGYISGLLDAMNRIHFAAERAKSKEPTATSELTQFEAADMAIESRLHG
jgi:hypothetical protein